MAFPMHVIVGSQCVGKTSLLMALQGHDRNTPFSVYNMTFAVDYVHIHAPPACSTGPCPSQVTGSSKAGACAEDDFFKADIHAQAQVKAHPSDLWLDVPGSERFRTAATAMIPRKQPGLTNAVVAYDVTDRSSFEDVTSIWVPMLVRQHVRVVLLLGLKADFLDPTQPHSDGAVGSVSADRHDIIVSKGDSRDLRLRQKHATPQRREVSYSDGAALAASLGVDFLEASSKTGAGVEQVGRGVRYRALMAATHYAASADFSHAHSHSEGVRAIGGVRLPFRATLDHP